MSDRRDSSRPFDSRDADAFVDGVLERTSGSACGRAQEQLDVLLDNRLAELDRQLVQTHLEHCQGCREVALALGWLGPLLPEMAEIDPGPGFLNGVLARTTGGDRPPLASDRPGGLAGLMDRVGRWWEGQVLRPAFATQAAYVATVLIVLVTATPWSPLRGVPDRALDVMTSGPREAPLIGPALGNLSGWIETGSADLAASGRSRVAARKSRLAAEIDARSERSATARDELKSHLRTMAARARDGELSEAGYELLAALRSGRTAWSNWWNASDERSGP